MANPVPAGSTFLPARTAARAAATSSRWARPTCPNCGNGQYDTVGGGDSVEDPYPGPHSAGRARPCPDANYTAS